jgi:type IV secretory pathway component VirB8
VPDELNDGAKRFEKKAVKLKRKMWWKNMKVLAKFESAMRAVCGVTFFFFFFCVLAVGAIAYVFTVRSGKSVARTHEKGTRRE